MKRERERDSNLHVHSCPPFSLVDIDGGYNAETNRVPRRIYIRTRVGNAPAVYACVLVCAYRLVSIYTRSGVFGPSAEEGPIPLSA